MTGNPQVLKALNDALASELTSIDYYWLHWRYLKARGYRELGHQLRDIGKDEHCHVKELLSRINDLDGTPVIGRDPVKQITDVVQILGNALFIETSGRALYRAGIDTAMVNKDYTTAEMMGDILADEEEHILWFEAQQKIIRDIGIAGYLSEYFEK